VGAEVQLSPVPRTALKREEAALSLGMGLDSFERYVQPYIRLLRRGKLRLVPVAELERFLRENAESTLPEGYDGGNRPPPRR
jgi:hypothetical protein